MKEKEKNGALKLAQVIERYGVYFKNPWKIFWTNFLRGVAWGFGTVIGMTILTVIFVSLVSYLINLFGGLPVIGKLISRFGDYITGIKR